MKKRVVILFGAGASTYSEPDGVKTPPLGDKLYAELAAGGFVPSTLPQAVIDLFLQPSGFEPAMACLSAGDSMTYTAFLRGMAKYLAPFAPTRHSYYSRLLREMAAAQAHPILATLNYDNLIEHALIENRYPARSLLKPHGSCGYLPNLGNVQLVGVNTQAMNSSLPPYLLETNQTDNEVNASAIVRWCDDPLHTGLAPVMSFYAPGKATAINSRFLEWQRERWREVVLEADVAFVVGVKCVPLDTHLWQALSDSKCRLIYVNPINDGFDAWVSTVNRRYAEHLPKKFDEAIPRMVAQASSKRF